MLMEILGRMNWVMETVEERFIADILKQESKLLTDPQDLKEIDINYIKSRYPSFEGKTEDTERVYQLILDNFPE